MNRIAPISIFCCLVLAMFVAYANAEVNPKAVIISLRKGSPALGSWNVQGRLGSLPIVADVVGTHSSEPYVQSSTLLALEKARSGNKLLKTRPNASPEVSRFVVVHYDADLDPFIVSRKLRSLPDIESAEPLPIQHLVDLPNDPDVERQYHVGLIQAYQAWDLLPKDSTIVLAVVDTGADTTHADLNANIWHNQGEMGLDGAQTDKRNNGIDDDANGFIDDWFGWDFIGATDNGGDNSPLPGHPHGTHVSGISAAVINNGVGGTGVASNIRVMLVKIARDDPFSTTVGRTADGILYAASMGAKVINCSFGSESPTFADVSVIQQAVELGALVVAAAGNDGTNMAFYPAAYPQVLSVAATNSEDKLAYFSNRHGSVDICAPGVAIYSTIPGNMYDYYDGTSMASPVAAAVAAMVRLKNPAYSPQQTISVMKATCNNIDSINAIFEGTYGSGRVNSLLALSTASPKWATITQSTFTDADADGYLEPGERLSLTLSLRNELARLTDAHVIVSRAPAAFSPDLTNYTVSVGPMATSELKDLTSPILVDLPLDVPPDSELRLIVSVYDANTLVSREAISSYVNPSYRTIQSNDLWTTVNSTGNIGYNNYPANSQGVGLSYKGGPSLLFEGALMIGAQVSNLPNVARGGISKIKDTSFHALMVSNLRTDSVVSGSRVVTAFSDVYDPYPAGVVCTQNVYALTADSVKNTLIIAIDVANTSDTTIRELYVSHFYDVDIGPGGSSNGCAWNSKLGFGLFQNTKRADLPLVGIAMISNQPINFFALDNDGDVVTGSPSIYDNFLRSEKWMTMTGGVRRKNSRITDVSAVIGAGPFPLAPGEHKQVCFVIAAGVSSDMVARGISSARFAGNAMGLNVVQYAQLPEADGIIYVEGSPLLTPGNHEIRFTTSMTSPVTIDIIDIFGSTIATPIQEPSLLPGTYARTINVPSVAQGSYFLRLTTYATTSSYSFGIVR